MNEGFWSEGVLNVVKVMMLLLMVVGRKEIVWRIR